MPTYKTQGIILKHIDIGEASRIFTIYTKDFGKISVRARAVKKPTSKLAGHLEPLTLSQLVLAQGKFLDIIIDALAINNFTNLRSSLKKLALGFYICELVDKLTGEKVPDERIFDLLLGALGFLERGLKSATPNGARNLRILPFYFGLKLLALLGFAPHHTVQGFAPEEELARKDIKHLKEVFNYYLQFAPEQNIQSEGFLNEVMRIGE